MKKRVECPVFIMFVLALVLLAQAEAASVAGSVHSTLSSNAVVDPPLKDKSSDKKFFGPPFPADYPDDKRPVVQKAIMDKLKGPEQPYPALQSKSTFDKDFVKDENSDTGAWQAQFEYDELRKKIQKEEADEKAAQGRAGKKAGDLEKAKADADAAGKDADAAQKDVDAAKANEDAKNKEGEDGTDGAPSQEKLEQLKKQLAEAEKNHELAKKAFAKCKAELEAAEKELADLQAKQAAMEKQLSADTQLWVEKHTMKLNVESAKKKAKQDAAADRKAKHDAKRSAAEAKLAAALKVKAEAEKVLAKEKAEHAQAQENVKKQKAELDKVKADLNSTAKQLQQMRGYKPETKPLQSFATGTPVAFALFAALAMHL